MKTLERKQLLTFRLLAVIAVAVVTFRLAWISDDSLITLRTALNITHGWGPGFNATEAVQAYTHPLWFLVWTIIGVVTNEWVWGILLLSIAFTSIAVGIVVWRTPSISRIVLVTGLLVFSNGFVEYATSGLENSLAYITIALAFALSASVISGTHLRWWIRPGLLGLTFAAVFLTRFDLVLLIIPVGIFVIVAERKEIKHLIVAGMAFVLPLIIWFSWSWVTYQSLLPNTFVAKRNVDIPQSELIIQGLRYLYVSFEKDPIIFILVTAGVLTGFVFGSLLIRVWTLGLVLYVGYVVYIGGDFMASRFLAVPAFISALILVSITFREPSEHRRDPLLLPAVSLAILTFLLLGAWMAGSVPTALANYQTQRWEFEQNTNAGVSDERGFYVSSGKSLREMIDKLSLAFTAPDIAPLGDGSGLNRSLREINKAAQNWPVNDGGFTLPSEVGVFCGGLGYLGMATGPITHIIDNCGLTDRFLAAQQFGPVDPFAWRMGHFARNVPEGYVDAVATDDPSKVVDRQLAFELEQLWEKIR